MDFSLLMAPCGTDPTCLPAMRSFAFLVLVVSQLCHSGTTGNISNAGHAWSRAQAGARTGLLVPRPGAWLRLHDTVSLRVAIHRMPWSLKNHVELYRKGLEELYRAIHRMPWSLKNHIELYRNVELYRKGLEELYRAIHRMPRSSSYVSYIQALRASLACKMVLNCASPGLILKLKLISRVNAHLLFP